MNARKKIYLSGAIKSRIQFLSPDEKGFLLDAMLIYNENGTAPNFYCFPALERVWNSIMRLINGSCYERCIDPRPVCQIYRGDMPCVKSPWCRPGCKGA